MIQLSLYSYVSVKIFASDSIARWANGRFTAKSVSVSGRMSKNKEKRLGVSPMSCNANSLFCCCEPRPTTTIEFFTPANGLRAEMQRQKSCSVFFTTSNASELTPLVHSHNDSDKSEFSV